MSPSPPILPTPPPIALQPLHKYLTTPFPASPESALLCGLSPNRCRSLPRHDLVPCVCLRGCHGANCCVYSCSPNAHYSVGICSNGSWCLVFLILRGGGDLGSIILTYISQHCPSGATDWNQAQEVVPISFLGSGADLGNSGLQLGGWAAFLSMESCFCFPSSPHGQQSKHELIGCAVWPALFSK